MRFDIRRTSSNDVSDIEGAMANEIEISTLEELLALLYVDSRHELVLANNESWSTSKNTHSIEIYDTWRE